MNEVTRILGAVQQGDPQATAQLLVLVHDELARAIPFLIPELVAVTATFPASFDIDAVALFAVPH